MTELEKIKQEVYDKLFLNGVDHETAKKVVDRFERITGYYNGKPSRVMLSTGIELYL